MYVTWGCGGMAADKKNQDYAYKVCRDLHADIYKFVCKCVKGLVCNFCLVYGWVIIRDLGQSPGRYQISLLQTALGSDWAWEWPDFLNPGSVSEDSGSDIYRLGRGEEVNPTRSDRLPTLISSTRYKLLTSTTCQTLFVSLLTSPSKVFHVMTVYSYMCVWRTWTVGEAGFIWKSSEEVKAH